MQEVVRIMLDPFKPLLIHCFRDDPTGVPWIGFRYHSDQKAYLWVNGEEVQRDYTNWYPGEVIKKTSKQ